MRYKIIKSIISLLFLIYLSQKIDLALLYDAVLSVKPQYYIVSFFVVFINSIILAQKYKLVMRPSGIYQSLSSLIKINFICRFYSMFLTTAVGQSVIRWHISTKNQEGRFKFIAVMIFERSTFFFALFFAVAISLLLIPKSDVKMTVDYIYPLLAAGLLGLLLFYFYLNYSPLYRLLNSILPSSEKKRQNIFVSNLYGCMRTFSMYYRQKKILFFGLCLAFMWHFFFLWRVYLLVISIQVPLSFVHLSWMASLVLLVQVLPISLNGIGLRETAYAFFFRIQDLPPEAGVLIGILLFSQMVLISAIGGVVNLFSKE